MKPATLEEIWEATINSYNKQYVMTDETTHKTTKDLVIIAMRIACNQTINMCIKNAELGIIYNEITSTTTSRPSIKECWIKLESILKTKDEIE